MKKLLLSLTLFVISISLPAQKPALSVFGTMHLHNPGNDKINADPGDINSPKHRVLVIFGAGHKEILDDLIRDRADWKWVDSEGFLKE